MNSEILIFQATKAATKPRKFFAISRGVTRGTAIYGSAARFNAPNTIYVTKHYGGCTVYSCFMPGSLE